LNSILITGVSGFIGNKLSTELVLNGYKVKGSTSKINNGTVNSTSAELYYTGEINRHTDWSDILNQIDCVIHTAAIAHRTNIQPEELFEVNFEATLNLARKCVNIGVKRFIFISSIGVNGLFTAHENKFHQNDIPNPTEDYAISKLKSEIALRELSKETGLEVVIIRPPLVYGPGVKGNFKKLLEWVYSGYPIPLGSIKNLRSFIGLDNLVDFISRCINHPHAPGKTFLISDNKDMSTPDLIRLLKNEMATKTLLPRIPISILNFGARLVGKKKQFERLSGSLLIDNSFACESIDWEPPYSLEYGIKEMVKFFLNEKVND
jgi:nucleoside-diphosphate-sugar epimerase